MASLADAAALTLRLHALAGELHREATDRYGDFSRMAELADQVSELADALAVVFERADAALEEALSKRPPDAATDEALAAVASPQAPSAPEPWRRVRSLRMLALLAIGRVWARVQRVFSSSRPPPQSDKLPTRATGWRGERPHPELLLLR